MQNGCLLQRVHADSDAAALPILRGVSDEWAMAKDGRSWFGQHVPKLMRKQASARRAAPGLLPPAGVAAKRVPGPGRWPGMDQGMTRDRWLSLGLQEEALAVFGTGSLQTVEAAGSMVVGIPKGGDGHYLLGTASSHEEAAVIATILRLFNPN